MLERLYELTGHFQDAQSSFQRKIRKKWAPT
jgi:hypothetical protein